MNEKNNDGLSEQQNEQRDLSQLNSVERFYERFRGVPIKKLDIFIWVCIAAIILVIAVGTLDARGFF